MEGKRLEVEVAARFVDALLVPLTEEVFAFDGLNLNVLLVQECTVILVPAHIVSVVSISQSFSVQDVIFETQVLLDLDLFNHLAGRCIPSAQILVIIDGHESIFDSSETNIFVSGTHTKEGHLVPV